MADRAWIEEHGNRFGVHVYVWGLFGDEALHNLERELGTALNEQVASFVRTVGNAHIGSSEVIITGNPEGTTNALIETNQIGRRHPVPQDLLMIMDNGGGLSFFLNIKLSEVVVFDSLRVISGEELWRFNSFDEFLGWIFEETKAGKEWSAKHWPQKDEKPSLGIEGGIDLEEIEWPKQNDDCDGRPTE